MGVVGYNIYRGSTKVNTALVATTSYKDTGLVPETTYTYTVKALDAAGNESDASNSVSSKTLVDTQAPTVPIGLNAQAVSISQINLTWTASTDNVAVTGYNIYRDGTKVGTSATTSHQDKGLAANSTHTYKVSAYDAKNNTSADSTTVTATTNADTSAPDVPTALTATPVSMTEIDLAWTASTDNVGVTGYKIYRGIGSSAPVQIGTSTTNSYKDTAGLTRSTAYNYTVAAYDAAGNTSAQTSPVPATTLSDTQAPTVPTGLAGTAASMTQIDLTWTASTDNIGVVGYKLFRNGTQIKDQTGTSFSDTGLTAGTSYTYTVLAYDAAGNASAQSAGVVVQTLVRKYSLSDFINLVTDWLQSKPGSPGDVSGDGVVNSKDLGIMMSQWQ